MFLSMVLFTHFSEYFLLAYSICFVFNDTATTEIYTLSLHDALPISSASCVRLSTIGDWHGSQYARYGGDRKRTRLNSSHGSISYAVVCLKKKQIRGICVLPTEHRFLVRLDHHAVLLV